MDIVKVYSRRRWIVQGLCIIWFVVSSLLSVYFVVEIAGNLQVPGIKDYGLMAYILQSNGKFWIVLTLFANLVISLILYFLGTAICDYFIMRGDEKSIKTK